MDINLALIGNTLVRFGLNVVGAIVILAVGWWIARWSAGLVARMGERSQRLDRAVTTLLSRLVRWTVLAFTVIAVLNRFGVQTASIVALLGAAGLAVGLALQGALSNVAAGVMLLALRPFRVGEAVDIGGTMGTVDDIGLFATRMTSFDGVPLFVPNSNIWGRDIRNFSRTEQRRNDLVVGVGYDDDIEVAMGVLRELVTGDGRVLAEPEPLFAVDSLGDSAVNLLARYWTVSGDWYATKLDMTRRVKERLDAAGVSIPFPQRDLHLVQEGPVLHQAS